MNKINNEIIFLRNENKRLIKENELLKGELNILRSNDDFMVLKMNELEELKLMEELKDRDNYPELKGAFQETDQNFWNRIRKSIQELEKKEKQNEV